MLIQSNSTKPSVAVAIRKDSRCSKHKTKTQRSLTKLNHKNQILNGGCLGSHNDEERSEVR